MDSPKIHDITIVPEHGHSPALMSPKEMKMQMAEETKKRKLIVDFIAEHMKRGIDFGPIHVVKDCPNKYDCGNNYHFSKDVLFKPGAEKFSSLFKLRPEYSKDTDTWEMLGSTPGVVCYICRFYTTSGALVGEGRGASSVGEKGNPNTAVKIAQKRAKIDAVLSTGALSDFFTQDLEEDEDGPKPPIKPKDESKGKNGSKGQEAPQTPKDSGKTQEPATSPKDAAAEFERAKKMISGSRNADSLFDWLNRLDENKLYDTEQKKELRRLISTRIDILNAN